MTDRCHALKAWSTLQDHALFAESFKMKIGELAQATGVSCDTLRFYEKRGLIRAVRGSNGYRSYAPETVQLIGYIRTAQHLGFSLAEIGESMPALWNAENPDVAVAQLLTEKVQAIDERIAALKQLKKELLERVAQVCPLSTQRSVSVGSSRQSA